MLKVTIAIPNRDDFRAEMVATLMRTITQTGALCNLTMPSTCYIDNARNQCWDDAKAFGSDYLLFMDSDNSIDYAGNAFQKFVELGKDVVSGVYVQRAFPYRPNVYNFTENGMVQNLLTIPNEPFRADATGCGYLLISKKVLDAFTPATIERVGKPFNFMRYGRPNELREDVAFCWRLKELGFELWFDPTIKMGHHGKQNFTIDHFEKAKENISASQKCADGGIDGWMTTEELAWLRTEAASVSSVAEIGCWKGRSTKELLDSCKGTVYAVDHWQGSDYIDNLARSEDVYAEFIKNVGNYQNLVIKRMASVEAAAEIEPIDLVFIDAGHTYKEIKADIDAWLPKAKKIISGHDYSTQWPDVVKAVNEKFGDKVKTCGTIWFVSLQE
ncbi:MAG TPA: class I SAM-dependent methyltransferase [Candidatus Paceibacterota bacterium]